MNLNLMLLGSCNVLVAQLVDFLGGQQVNIFRYNTASLQSVGRKIFNPSRRILWTGRRSWGTNGIIKNDHYHYHRSLKINEQKERIL